MNFSVLISVYYKEKNEYLQEAIESLLFQTQPPSQIVLVKDGPLTEDLEELIHNFCKNNRELFTIVEFPTNQGLGIALREGLKYCKYELVARMDGDDICHKERFSKQLKCFEKNPDLDIVGSAIAEFSESKEKIISERKMPLKHDEISEFARKRNPYNHMTVMFRKQAVLQAGNYEDFLWFEDYFLWVKMLINGCHAENLEESLVYARTGDLMFERRGGIAYAKQELLLQKKFLKMGFVSFERFTINCLIRLTSRILPNPIRRMLYLKLLR